MTPSVRVQNLQLNYPLYTQRVGQNRINNETDVDRERLITNSRGDVVGIKALQNISFDVQAGERIGIVGGNGSGKTSLLQVLAGVLTPEAGFIEINGRTTSLVNINLGMSEQASGHRNITLRGLAGGWNTDEIESHRNEIARFSELGDFLNLPVSTYSSGMRMRLNFAIATAFEPDVLILDEWLSAGDVGFREKATKRMNQFVDRAGILILATHNPTLIRSVCTRALWMDGGKVVADGDIEDVVPAYGREMLARNAVADRK